MNMHAQMHTAAEKALFAAYDTLVSDLPGDGAVTIKRDNALEQLKVGLPTKRIEAWHYTDLRRLLTKVPELPTRPRPSRSRRCSKVPWCWRCSTACRKKPAICQTALR